jgi:hypothetical protein
MVDEQKQKVGDNSLQVQAETLVIGIDEKRVREVFTEMWQIAKQNFTFDAMVKAVQRSTQFGEKLISKMITENALSAFADPAFQILLKEAQKSAASTEREADYDLLSELMLHRFKKGENRNTRAGISRAVEIVDQISDEALLGLTIIHAVSFFLPGSGKMSQGLDLLNTLFSKLIYANLPPADKHDWLEHLDILDAIRLSSLGSMKKLEDYWYSLLDGYTALGVEKHSPEHKEIIRLLTSVNFSANILTENEFDTNKVKLPIPSKNRIKHWSKSVNGEDIKLTLNDQEVLEKVFDLCAKNKMSKKDFITELDKRAHLKILREWWNKLDMQINITSVGKVLAHSNAQRIDKELPPLN